jgi:hypothetical protein
MSRGEMEARVRKGMKLTSGACGSTREERGGSEIGRRNPKKKMYF